MKKIICTILIFILTMSVAFATPSDWAKDYIEKGVFLGLVPDNLSEDYQEDLTRAEFSHLSIKLISAMTGTADTDIIKDADSSIFKDTNDPYISAAYSLGIISGTDEGSFLPDNNINRQEAAKILVNTYSFLKDLPPSASEKPYTDYDKISDWAKPYVNMASSLSLMEGLDDGSFSPFNTYTREQAIVTFIRLYETIILNGGISLSSNKNPEITGMLSVKDGYLFDGEKNVLLNGINLGGWLLIETWMNPVDATGYTAYSDLISVLGSRFGEYKAHNLISLYEESYITEKDFETIEALGFNCVRIPFWYRNFTDANGNYLPNSSGHKRIDWAIEQCKKHNIYIILDMHGCPGGQSMDHSTGVTGRNELYDNEKNLKIMENVWVNIAKKYKDNEYIAAYDIMNEPQNNGGWSGENAWQPGSIDAVSRTNSVYDRMIKAIRKVDKNHVITVEGIWSVDTLPDPKDYGWENMMYQLHIYDTSKYMIDYRIKELTDARENYGVAAYVGEYNSKGMERYARDKYLENSVNTSKWTYKTVNVWYDGWGLFNKNTKGFNISTSSYDDMALAYSDEILTENGFKLNLFEYLMIK